MRTRLVICNEKIDELNKSIRTKDEILQNVEQKLEKERLESDAMKIGLVTIIEKLVQK